MPFLSFLDTVRTKPCHDEGIHLPMPCMEAPSAVRGLVYSAAGQRSQRRVKPTAQTWAADGLKGSNGVPEGFNGKIIYKSESSEGELNSFA